MPCSPSIAHIRGHTQFPGTLAYGNHQADSKLHFTGSLFIDAFQSHQWASLVAQTVKRLSAMQETQVLSLGEEGNGSPLQYSCLENPMDRRAW